MKVFVLGLDGATWDLLRPLADAGELPNLVAAHGRGGVAGRSSRSSRRSRPWRGPGS